MKSSALCFCAVLVVVVNSCLHSARADDHVLSATLANFDGQVWASISAAATGYQLRLLTEAEKAGVDKTMMQYSELRGRRGASTPDNAKVLSAYRTLPSDVRTARFYRVARGTASSIILKGDDTHAILPMSSISVVLMGPKGQLTSGRSTTSASTMLQALSGGGGMVGGRGSNMSGLLGGGRARIEAADLEEAREVSLIYLKHARAERILEILQEIHGDDRGMRATVDERTNAVIVNAQPTTIEKVTQLVEALDKEVKPTKAKAGEQRLETYSVGKADPNTVYAVLQTLLAKASDVRLALDVKTGKIIVLARAAEHSMIKALLEVF